MRMTRQGFTLIEIMLVVIIIAVLAATVVPRLAGRTEQAKVSRAQLDVANIEHAISLYELDVGSFPESLGNLMVQPADVPEASWRGPYLKQRTKPIDPWGGEYVYLRPGQHNTQDYDLSSNGPDGRQGTDDDITNWGASI